MRVQKEKAGKVYLFFRQGPTGTMFYPVELKDDEDAKRNAEHNPGTLKVETVNGRLVWSPMTRH